MKPALTLSQRQCRCRCWFGPWQAIKQGRAEDVIAVQGRAGLSRGEDGRTAVLRQERGSGRGAGK